MKHFLNLSKKRKIIVCCALVLFLVFVALFLSAVLTIPKATLVFYIDEKGQESLYQTLQSEASPKKQAEIICFGVGGVFSFLVLGGAFFVRKGSKQ